MTIFYIIGIHIFNILVHIASIFNAKASLWIKGRKQLFQRLKNDIKPNENISWFHCASLGEFEQGRPVIEAYKQRFPEFKILVTFYSPSGYEVRKDYEHADYVYYLPIDTPKNAKRFINIVNPSVVFFIKYEFWYCFLKETHRRNIPLYLVSGIFRENQRFFRTFGRKSRNMLMWFTHFFVQNEESKKLLGSIGINKVTVTGDTRFDRVHAITQQSKDLPLIEKFAENATVLIAGSSWKPDEDIIIKSFNENNNSIKLIIAPHEIHSDNIKRIIKTIKDSNKVIKYSEANFDNIKDASVLIIDSIGLLSSVYKYGDIAYIGGGFGRGIHNTLEAATFGLPIIFGPNYKKFKEATDLISTQGAFSITSQQEYDDILFELLKDNNELKKIGLKTSTYVKGNLGATEKILSIVSAHKR